MSPAPRLRSTEPPWVELRLLPSDQPPLGSPGAGWDVPPEFVIRTVDGRRCGTKAATLETFGRALGFPAHAGRNWDAFEESLADLSWLPGTGYLIVVSHADRLLAGRPREYATLIALLETVGQEWARPRTDALARGPVPFHVVLTVTAARRRARRNWRVPTVLP